MTSSGAYVRASSGGAAIRNDGQSCIRKKNAVRYQEYTRLGWSMMQGTANLPPYFQFRVMSYNILADTHMATYMDNYKKCPPGCLSWEIRKKTLFQEFLAETPDISCLQEVEGVQKEDLFEPLRARGYDVLYVGRGGDRPDGCAVTYRTSEFRVADFTPIHFQRPEVALLDRPNVGMVVKFEVKRHPGHFVVVANTHLLYNPRRTDIKLCQLTILLAETERMASCGPNKYHPVILAGDLNARADSGLISLLRNGSVDCRDVVPGHWQKVRTADRETLSVPIGLLGRYLNISDTCQYFDVVAARAQGVEDPRKTQGLEELLEKLRVCPDIGLGSTHDAGLSQAVTSPPKNQTGSRVERNYIAPPIRSSSWRLRHPFHFVDVYQHPISGRQESLRHGAQQQMFVKDYIFYNVNSSPDQLMLVSRLRLPTYAEYKTSFPFLPNHACGIPKSFLGVYSDSTPDTDCILISPFLMKWRIRTIYTNCYGLVFKA